MIRTKRSWNHPHMHRTQRRVVFAITAVAELFPIPSVKMSLGYWPGCISMKLYNSTLRHSTSLSTFPLGNQIEKVSIILS
jgi:hypothetical protein